MYALFGLAGTIVVFIYLLVLAVYATYDSLKRKK